MTFCPHGIKQGVGLTCANCGPNAGAPSQLHDLTAETAMQRICVLARFSTKGKHAAKILSIIQRVAYEPVESSASPRPDKSVHEEGCGCDACHFKRGNLVVAPGIRMASASPQVTPQLYLWVCIICGKRVQSRRNLHINERLTCAECNAEMEPAGAEVIPE